MSIPPEDAYLDTDKLPQPYRLVAKIIGTIVDNACEEIEAKIGDRSKAYTEEGKTVVEIGEGLRTDPASSPTVVETDLYLGTDQGALERWNVVLKEKTLETTQLHETRISHLSAVYINVPVAATTDGKNLKIVCFPLAPARRTNSISLASSQHGGPTTVADLDEISRLQNSERDRMVTLYEMTLQNETTDLVFSPCGEYLAVVSQESVLICLIGKVKDTPTGSSSPPEVLYTAVCKTPSPHRPQIGFTTYDGDREGVVTVGAVIAWIGGFDVVCVPLHRIDVLVEDVKVLSPKKPEQPPRKMSKPGKVVAQDEPPKQQKNIPEPNPGVKCLGFHCVINAVAMQNEVLAVACQGGTVQIFDLTTREVLLTTAVDYRRASRKPSEKNVLECYSIAIWSRTYLATSWGFRTAETSTIYIHDFCKETIKIGDRTADGIVKQVKPDGSGIIETSTGGESTVEPGDMIKKIAIGEILGVPTCKTMYFCKIAPFLLFAPSLGSSVGVYDVKSGEVTSVIPLKGETSPPKSIEQFSDGALIIGTEGCYPVPLPAIVSSAYPALGRALSAYAGLDHTYSLLNTCFFRDLHDEEVLQAKIFSAPVKSTVLSTSQRTGKLQKSKSRNSMHKVGFDSADPVTSDHDTSTAKPSGAKAKCLIYVQNKRREKAARRTHVTNMLSELHKYL